METMSFSEALDCLKNNQKITRTGWNGKGMYIYLNKENSVITDPFISMKTAQNTIVPWVASQTDLLSNDWIIYI